jgi:peptidyl-dipeptidase Dcp
MTSLNPLLIRSTLFDEAVPFQQIKIEHYLPAVDEGIRLAKEKIEKIKANENRANFENTIEALEFASEQMEYAVGVYFNLFSANANDQFQSLAKDISSRVAAFQSDVNLDAKLFEKIKYVHDHRGQLHLSSEKNRLLENYYKDFVRNGAMLSNEDKEKLRSLDQDISILSPQFAENVLKSTNAFELLITNKSDLSGLPEGVIEAAALTAKSKGHKEGTWVFNLQYPSFGPFLQYGDNRELREKLWRAYNKRAYNDEFDNQALILKTVDLKHKRAQLLGFRNHAEFVLQERMAQTSEQVFNFLQRLLVASKPAAIKDLAELKQFMKELSGNEDIKPWDTAYYSEKLKEKNYKLNSEELRPYFSLEKVVQGAFDHAKKLYGLVFRPIENIETYHPDVKVYEVHDQGSDEYIGLFYTDFFPRETKKGGAWATTYRNQGYHGGKLMRPHASIVCNFTKPTTTKPSLLSYDEVNTLFHEFGHALHGLLSKCHYRSLSGNNVYWDFVELPSQIMENWIEEKEGLDLFAHHYETNAGMPDSLIEKIKRAALFQSGMMTLRQLSFSLLDMAWHTTNPAKITSVSEFETAATESTRLLPKIEGSSFSCAFTHIFAGGYSAGYYSYKWAEVLDADAFEFFKEKGLFNQEVAKLFREFILSKGGTEHPMELYKKFRGREPDANALLRRDGLI